ncbi:MAG: vWA domain-containing protein [Chloroflexota bacterium]
MQRGFTAWCLIILLVASLFVWQTGPATAAPTAAAPVDVVVLIDSSGSMSKSDPSQLSLTASRMMIDLLAPGDRIALIDFDTKATVLAPLTAVNDAADREALRGKLAKVRADGSTDYDAALTMAYDQLADAKGDSSKRLVIFLTDGQPDPGGKASDQQFMNEYLAGLQATVDKFVARGWPVHTIGLGNQPDPTLLRDMALDTGGSYYRVSSAADLTGVFAGILTEAKGIYLGAKYDRTLATGSSTDTISIDRFTRGVTVVAAGRQGQPVELAVSNAGVTLTPGSDGVERRSGTGYDALFITAPKAGALEVTISGSGDATLMLLYDKSVGLDLVAPAANARQLVGRPLLLQARLTRGDAAFSGKIVAHVLRPGTTIADDVNLFDDGKHSDGAAGDGIYGNTWTGVQSEGDYRVLIEAMQDKTPVVSRSLQVYGEALPIMIVDAPAAGTHYRGERMTLAVHFALAGLPIPAAETAGLTVKAVITTPNGAGSASTQLTLADDGNAIDGDMTAGDGVFSGLLIPDSEGDHLVTFTADGALRGRAYHDEITLPAMPVASPVFIKVTQVGGSAGVAPGGSGKLTLELSSESEADETVEIGLLQAGVLTAKPVTVTVPAKGQIKAELVLEAAANAALGDQPATVIVCKGRTGVSFEPPTLQAAVRIGRSNTLTIITGAVGALILLAALLVAGYIVCGQALYRAALGKAHVGGVLSWSGKSTGSADLATFGRWHVSVGGPGSDVVLPGCDAPVLFRIRTRLLSIGSPVRLGWASLSGKLSFGCEVVAEGDHRVSFRDFPKGLERLFQGDEFRCGDFAFQYENGKLPPRPRRGA